MTPFQKNALTHYENELLAHVFLGFLNKHTFLSGHMWLNTISERTVKNSSLKVMICVKKITGLQIIQHKLKTAYAKLIKYELDHCLVTITFPNFK
jgi:hypothetical protein